MAKIADEITVEIRVTDMWIEEFKSNMEGEGYHDIKIDYVI